MTGLLDAVNENADITVIISDNLTTAMTGGQDSAGTNKFEAICKGLGVSEEHLKVVVPLPKNMEEIKKTIEEEINYHGVSVIIPRSQAECAIFICSAYQRSCISAIYCCYHISTNSLIYVSSYPATRYIQNSTAFYCSTVSPTSVRNKHRTTI